jgi:hypothetical protein
MTDRLDDALVDAYVGRFRPRELQAPFWLIGREEGGSDDVARISRNLESWEQKGRPELETFGSSPSSKLVLRGGPSSGHVEVSDRASVDFRGTLFRTDPGLGKIRVPGWHVPGDAVYLKL